VRDDETVVLAETSFPTTLEKTVSLTVVAKGTRITATADDAVLEADDASDAAFRDGGIGLQVADGALSTDAVHVRAA
jgi:hypothetical protein